MNNSLIALLGAAVVVAACGDASAPSDVVAPDAPSLAGGPTAGFSVVMVNPHAPAQAVGAVTSDMAEAVARVAAGGTVRVMPGTYMVGDVVINKPLTIEAATSTKPVLDPAGAYQTFVVQGAFAGTVTIRGFELLPATWANVIIHAEAERVTIEDSEIYPASQEIIPDYGLAYGSGVDVWADNEAEVVVRNSRFIGGDIGVTSDGHGLVLVEGNQFVHQTNAAVHMGGAVRTEVNSNEVRGCSRHWCFGSFHAREVVVTNNRIHREDEGLGNSMQLGGQGQEAGGTVVVTGNTIVGRSGFDPTTDYDLSDDFYSAINIGSWTNAVVSGNTIRNSEIGIGIDDTRTSVGSDNVIQNVGAGMYAAGSPNVTLTENDITDYVEPFIDWSAESADYTCNWWGSAAGPHNAPFGSNDVYTPWATAPISGTDGTSCSGAL